MIGTTELTDQQFELLGVRMKDAWDTTVEDPAGDHKHWHDLLGELKKQNMIVRHLTTGNGDILLVLEEHRNPADAYWAAREYNGSTFPLRSVAWVRAPGGWRKRTG